MINEAPAAALRTYVDLCVKHQPNKEPYNLLPIEVRHEYEAAWASLVEAVGDPNLASRLVEKEKRSR